ncbi:MAG: N-6 DNA methylase [Parachlamydiaceae bacterium]
MTRDTLFHEDIYNDLFVTFGGLISKKILNKNAETKLKPKELKAWNAIKHYSLKAVNTHDEVKERQPVLIGLFNTLKVGIDIIPLNREGDILLRDFIVEVKQPSLFRLSSVEASSIEANDQQLLRAMKFRKKKWGILTNAAEWQFVYHGSEIDEGPFIPFISFSILDMIRDEEIALPQIKFFLGLLLSRETRSFLIRETMDIRARRTKSFANHLGEIVDRSRALGLDDNAINEMIKVIFRLTFIFYCEDIGVLPRHERKYRSCDIRLIARKTGKFNLETVKSALRAFSEQKWSVEKNQYSGNSEFWSIAISKWLDKYVLVLNQLNVHSLWLSSDGDELDLSDISSSDLCDVYQHCVTYGSENIGTVYTSRGLSNFVNHLISTGLSTSLVEGDIILDPACGSGHLLKRAVFICERLVDVKLKFKSRQDLVEYFCTNHLAGIDKNETAVFISKINIWLTCASKGRSLPLLSRFEADNTLKRFADSYSQTELQLSSFLGKLGGRVRVVVSNPPWSMVLEIILKSG